MWKPTDKQKKQKEKDIKLAKKMYDYRREFEEDWLRNAHKWNLVAGEKTDGMPNFVVPLTRMITHTGIVSMRQGLPEIRVVPAGRNDKKKAELISDASAHIDRMSNMEAEMDQGIVDYAVLGNLVLEDYVKTPYKQRRYKQIDDQGNWTGDYTITHVRDWSLPKMGTRVRSPWTCAFDPGARNVRSVRRCTFTDIMSEEEFEEKYVNIPEEVNTYINTDEVEGEFTYLFDDKGELIREQKKNTKVYVENIQDELEDAWRIYANGVLIWDVPLSSVHAHGKITLSLIPNHHIYDKNGKTHALYGAGDPKLLEDLDDLVNAATNLFIQNYERKNTYVVGIAGGGFDITNDDIENGKVVSGQVSVASLGQADLPEFIAFKDQIEEWAIQMAKKNFKRLQGETAQTATEITLKKRSEDAGMLYQIKVMESGGMLEHAKKRVSDIMEHMTQEEWEEIVEEDLDRIKDMLDEGELAKEDVVYEKGKPVQVKHIEKFTSRGRVYEEVFIKGKRHVSSLREVKKMRGQDGLVPASKEYLWTREYAIHRGIPDVYLVGKAMLGEDKMSESVGFSDMINQILGMAQLWPELKELIDPRKLLDKAIELRDLRKEEYKAEATEEGKSDDELSAIEEQLRNLAANPSSNVLTSNTQESALQGSGEAPAESTRLAQISA